MRFLKLVPPHWVRKTRRNSKLLLCEAPKWTDEGTGTWTSGFAEKRMDGQIDGQIRRRRQIGSRIRRRMARWTKDANIL